MVKVVQVVKTITNNRPILFVVFLIAFWGINRFFHSSMMTSSKHSLWKIVLLVIRHVGMKKHI